MKNKIGTGEHSDQLRRYHRVVNQHYRGWRVVGLYLTPSGKMPSHEAYLPVDYSLVCDIIDGLAKVRASVVSSDLEVLMTHYAEMLRRHIVGDSEIARLCQQIYQKHKRALDLIYEHRPDLQAEIKDLLEKLVRDTPGMELEWSLKNGVGFAVQEWDDVPGLLTAQWTHTGRVLLFELENDPGRLRLKLTLGPGADEIRQKVVGMVRSNPDVFRVPKVFGAKWSMIYVRSFLEQELYEDTDFEDIEREIRRRWSEFLEKDLPRMEHHP
jgi:hypothetical protein